MNDDQTAVDDAECCVLSALLSGDSDAVERAVSTGLRPTDFLSEVRASVYSGAVALHGRGAAVDPVTVIHELATTSAGKNLDSLRSLIGSVVDFAPTSANVASHAAIVVEASRRRTLAFDLERSAGHLRYGGARGEDVVSEVRAALDAFPSRTASRFQLWTYKELAELPPPVALVDGVLFADSLVTVVGKYASMKTFLLLDLALSIAHGVPWHGRAVQRGPVVYIYPEGRRAIPSRIRAWRMLHRCSDEADIRFVTTSVMVDDPRHVEDLLQRIRSARIRPVAVFVDPLAQNMSGDEQTAFEMGAFIRGCRAIREAFEAAVVTAHHTGWNDKRSRGSIALPSAADTEVQVEYKNSLVTLKCTKQKDAPPFPPIRLKPSIVAGSVALRSVEEVGAELTSNEIQALQVLQRAGTLPATQWLANSGLSDGTFYGSLKRFKSRTYVRHVDRRYSLTDAGVNALTTALQFAATADTPIAPPELQTTLPPNGGSVVAAGADQ